MNWIAPVCVYVSIIFAVVILLYINGKEKPTQDRLQDELDAQMIMDPAQRIPGKEWVQIFIVLALFAIVFWAIGQYFSDILSAVREYMNL